MTRAEKVVLLACAAIISIHAVASFVPKERLWGVNQLAYISSVPRWLMIVLAFLILVPRINRVVYDALAGLFSLVEKSLKRTKRYYKYILFSLGSIVLFWVLRAKTYLLGDGHLRGGEILAGTRFSATEPLDFCLHALAYKFLKLEAHQTYTLISCLAGALFVFMALWFSHLLGKDNKERILAFVVLVTMGSVQLFFGYIESYSLVYVGMLAYFLLSFLYLRGRCGLFFPSLALLTSISLHLSAAYLLPSLIYLHLVNPQKDKGRSSVRQISSVALILLLVGVGFAVVIAKNPNPTSITSYLIPLAGSENDPYSLFSFAHLVDVINEQLLLSPGGIILWVIIFFVAVKINLRDRVVRFLVIATIFSFAFAFLMDPKLGYARDWDLFSSTGLSITILGIYLGFKYFRQAQTKKLNYAILALTCTALLSTVPWIYVNAREDKAVERFKALLEVDVERSGYGHEILAYYYRDKKLLNEETEQWGKALSVIENERYVTNLGMSYQKLGRHQEAAAMFNKAIQMNPDDPKNYVNLGNAFFSLRQYEEAKRQYQGAIDKDPSFLSAYENLGVLAALTGDYEGALGVFDSVLHIDPDHFPAYINIARIYSKMGKPEDVIPLLEAYLDRNPKDYQRVQRLLKKMNVDLN